MPSSKRSTISIGHACCRLGAEREQRRVAKGAVAATKRLAGRMTDVLRQRAPPVRGDHVELPVLGAETAQQRELGDRLADPADRTMSPARAPSPAERLDRCGRRDHEQLVKRRFQAGREDR
jgi:hypothetical protein